MYAAVLSRSGVRAGRSAADVARTTTAFTTLIAAICADRYGEKSQQNCVASSLGIFAPWVNQAKSATDAQSSKHTRRQERLVDRGGPGTPSRPPHHDQAGTRAAVAQRTRQ